VLSFTGGAALTALRTKLGAQSPAPLYGTIDPEEYMPGSSRPEFTATLSHLGTYAADRAEPLSHLFVDVAKRRPEETFLIAGPKYPPNFDWLPNVFYIEHVPPADHRDFYTSSSFTLNLTRAAMARLGYCPQGRLFEAAACESVVISDRWEGLEHFFEIGSEICCASTTEEVLAALHMSAGERTRIGRAARSRVLAHHTAAHRAQQLEQILDL
jgi:spore maturation protein CgeB